MQRQKQVPEKTPKQNRECKVRVCQLSVKAGLDVLLWRAQGLKQAEVLFRAWWRQLWFHQFCDQHSGSRLVAPSENKNRVLFCFTNPVLCLGDGADSCCNRSTCARHSHRSTSLSVRGFNLRTTSAQEQVRCSDSITIVIRLK